MSYITASEFRKLSCLIEILAYEYDRKDIWFKEDKDDGWNLYINKNGNTLTCTHFSEEEIREMPVMPMLDRVLKDLGV